MTGLGVALSLGAVEPSRHAGNELRVAALPPALCSWSQGRAWSGASPSCWLTFAMAPGRAGALTVCFVSTGPQGEAMFLPSTGAGVSLGRFVPFHPPWGDSGAPCCVSPCCGHMLEEP